MIICLTLIINTANKNHQRENLWNYIYRCIEVLNILQTEHMYRSSLQINLLEKVEFDREAEI